MVLRFLRWWGGELAAMLPGRRDGGREASGQWLTVSRETGRGDGDRVRVRLGGSRGGEVLADVAAVSADALAGELGALAAALDPRRLRIRFVLPRDTALVKDIELPRAAQENLHEVLAFEMSRHTPFRAEQVWFSHRVLGHDGARLRVRLQVVPRARVQPLLEPFAGWRLEPESEPVAGGDDGDGAPVALAFRPAEWRRRSWAGVNAALACAVLALAVLCAWQPVAAQRDAKARLEARAGEARAAAAEAAALRDRIDAMHASRALIADARGRHPPMTVLLESISQALPDGTYLFRLEIRDEQVNLHGSSTAASSLIAILESTGALRGVRFASPVTRDGATGHERFHIVADFEPPAAAAG